MAKSLLKQVLKTVGKLVMSNTGKAIGNVLNGLAIAIGRNLVTDAIMGNNIMEELKREKTILRQELQTEYKT